MLEKYLKEFPMRRLVNVIKNRSVRIVIVLIFTIEILCFAMLTGYLSYTSGLNTVTENTNQVAAMVNAYVGRNGA